MKTKLPSILSCVFVTALCSLGGFLGEQTPVAEHPSCEPSEAAREWVEEFDLRFLDCPSRLPCWQDLLARVEPVLALFPDEIHLHRPYLQNLFGASQTGQPERFEGALVAYGDRARRERDNPAAQYLYAYLLEGEEELQAYRRSLEAEDDYPWGHWGLAYAYSRTSSDSSQAKDEAKAKAHLEAFLAACPNRFREPLLLRTRITDEEFWLRLLPTLRDQVAEAPPRQRALALPWLWQLEFRLAPVTEHGGMRRRLRAELESFEAAHPPSDVGWASALERVYRVAGAPDASRRLKGRRLTENPCSSEAVGAQLEAFAQGLGTPRENGEELAFGNGDMARRLYQESSGWLSRCPDSWQLYLARFQAATQLEDLPDEVILQEAEAMLAAWTLHRNSVQMMDSPYVYVARALLRRRLALERVEPLLNQDRALLLSSEASSSASSLGEEDRRQVLAGRLLKLAQLDLLASEAALRLGQPERTVRALEEAASRLQSVEAPSLRQEDQLAEAWARYWQLRGQWASQAGHKLDAMAFFRKVPPHLWDPDLSAESPPEVALFEPGTSLPTEAQWKEGGGSEEGWKALASSLPSTGGADSMASMEGSARSDWDSRRDTLHDFQLVDLHGKTWKPADLAGKVTLINLWATWCPPCRIELPFVQELHLQLARRPELQVITLNLDSDPGLVAPYVDEHRLGFPVLFGESYFNSLEVSRAVPQSWIVDVQGVIRRGQTGFLPGEGPGWAAEALLQMEEVKATYGPASQRTEDE